MSLASFLYCCFVVHQQSHKDLYGNVCIGQDILPFGELEVTKEAVYLVAGEIRIPGTGKPLYLGQQRRQDPRMVELHHETFVPHQGHGVAHPPVSDHKRQP